jgi:hypothetical protein
MALVKIASVIDSILIVFGLKRVITNSFIIFVGGKNVKAAIEKHG